MAWQSMLKSAVVVICIALLLVPHPALLAPALELSQHLDKIQRRQTTIPAQAVDAYNGLTVTFFYVSQLKWFNIMWSDVFILLLFFSLHPDWRASKFHQQPNSFCNVWYSWHHVWSTGISWRTGSYQWEFNRLSECLKRPSDSFGSQHTGFLCMGKGVCKLVWLCL